eukprot:Amastigsp_a1878_7.p1 type:complete len:917 gc:universal Amastigsp_a1878_7:31-2781(+)
MGNCASRVRAEDGDDTSAMSVVPVAPAQRVQTQRRGSDAAETGTISSDILSLDLAQAQALLHCAALINSSLDHAEVLAKILEAAKGLIPVERTSLFVVDENSSELYSIVADGTAPLRFSRFAGIAGQVLNDGRTLHVPDAARHPSFQHAVATRTGYVPRDLLAAPIVLGGGETIGVIELLGSTRATGFTSGDRTMIEIFASYCAIALNNTKRYQESVRAVERAFLFEFSRLMAGAAQLPALLQSLMGMARQLVAADRASVFLLDAPANELYTYAADGGAEIRVRVGAGIAGFVAATGQTLNVRNAYLDQRFDRAADIATGYQSRSLLCVPLRWRRATIGTVMLLNKTTAPGFFTEDDVHLCEAFGALVASVVASALEATPTLDAAAQIDSVVRIAQAFTSSDDPLALVASVVGRAAKLVGAMRFSVFVYDRIRNALRAKADNITGEDLGQVEIVVPIDASSIVGSAALSGEEIALADAYDDPRFNSAVDRATGFRTRSMLVVPIRAGADAHGPVLAVVQLINKCAPDGTVVSFSREDRDIVRAFGAFCGIGISPEFALPLAGSETSLDAFMASTEALTEPERAALFSWEFEPFSVPFGKLVLSVIALFERFDLLSAFRIEYQHLYRFIREVERRYRPEISYHNFVHAVDVTHCLAMMIIQAELIGTVLLPLDVLTLLLAGLVHDVDHQGLTNAYHTATASPFALAHPHGSVMESHHVAQAVSLLSRRDCAVLAGLAPDEYKAVWEGLIGAVLATDAAANADGPLFDSLSASASASQPSQQPSQPFAVDNREHRLVVMRQLIRAADISNAFRPWKICQIWARRVASEFYAQGALERSQGLPSSPFFDPSKTPLEQMQIGFIQHVARPFFAKIVAFAPLLRPQLETMGQNLANWRAAAAAGPATAAPAATGASPAAAK